jgi:diguanylate cyclase (GGDEF)-like protein
MTQVRRPLVYLVLGIGTLTAALLFAFHLQKVEAVAAVGRAQNTNAALTAMLDQETGLRGFLYTGQEDLLAPYLTGRAEYAQARSEVAHAAVGDPASVRLASEEDAAAGAWQRFAVTSITERRASSKVPSDEAQQALYGKAEMDSFRGLNTALESRLNERSDRSLRDIGVISTIVVMLLAALIALLGFKALRRTSNRVLGDSQRESAYRGRQREFSDLIQAVESEDEAQQLVQRHLERSLPSVTATLLNDDNVADRLQASTPLPVDSALAQILSSDEPRSCLAIRLGRAHRGGSNREELLLCNACNKLEGAATCHPLVAGGKVIGSVLVEQTRPLDDEEHLGVIDTVAQAAPVLANFKILALAETRASTDALTELPNRRAMNEMLKRMAAQAGRAAQPLGAIAFDLDHFKTINDRYGHEVGDAALSAVGKCLRQSLRDSDFAARIGGEEFLVLAPNTDVEGARVLAEKLRAALAREEIPRLPEAITASFGVAAIPDHAASPEALLRSADHACYVAKGRGRNRVEIAESDQLDPLPAVPTLI